MNIAVATLPLVAVLVVAIGAMWLVTGHASDQRFVRERVALRASSSATFIGSYLQDAAGREWAWANGRFQGQTIPSEEIEAAVTSFGYQTAVVLEPDGRVAASWPPGSATVSTVLDPVPSYLATAQRGVVGVSDVAASVNQGVRVISVAISFDSPSGRRVFSGGFSTGSTPLIAFARSALPAEGDVYLVDGRGEVITSTRQARAGTMLADLDPAVSGHLGRLTKTVDRGRHVTIAASPVPGSRWKLVLVSPDGVLLAKTGVEWLSWALLAGLAVVLGATTELVRRLSASRIALDRANEQLDETSRRDPMTGLFNRRQLLDDLAEARSRHARDGVPFALAVCDVDYFKAVNDRLGHQAGDATLTQVGDVLSAGARDGDRVYRYGGEEFVVLLHAPDDDGAFHAAERLRSDVESSSAGVTISVGVATVTDNSDPDWLLGAADAALYDAKRQGRNQVCRFAEVGAGRGA
jgi:diguanylate cyclase (GGDEF)-like protein